MCRMTLLLATFVLTGLLAAPAAEKPVRAAADKGKSAAETPVKEALGQTVQAEAARRRLLELAAREAAAQRERRADSSARQNVRSNADVTKMLYVEAPVREVVAVPQAPDPSKNEVIEAPVREVPSAAQAAIRLDRETKTRAIEPPVARVLSTVVPVRPEARAEVPKVENPKVAPGAVTWKKDFAAACAAAKDSGRPVLLFQLLGRLDDEFC